MAIGNWLNRKENIYTPTPKTPNTPENHHAPNTNGGFVSFVSGGLNIKCEKAERFKRAFAKIAEVYPLDFKERLKLLPADVQENHSKCEKMPTETPRQIEAWKTHWMAVIARVAAINANNCEKVGEP